MSDDIKEIISDETEGSLDTAEQTAEIIESSNKTHPEAELTPSDETAVDSAEELSVDEISSEEEEVPAEEGTPTEEEPDAEEEAHSELSDNSSSEITVEPAESPYIKTQYLRYGFEEDLPFIKTKNALSFLIKSGFGNNSLTQAREKIQEAEKMKGFERVNVEGRHYCDFCYRELGAEYDILNDGRERCYECSRTIIESVEEFRDTFLEIKKNEEVMFGINFFTGIDVKFLDSKQLHKLCGDVFVPTPGADARTLGFAQQTPTGYHICIENQSPYLSAVATVAHELTHIWQYLNWDERHIAKTYYELLKQKYPEYNPRLLIYEGMAKWAEIQYLYSINETERAKLECILTLQRKDEYGKGFALYYKEYGLTDGTFPDGPTPFFDKAFPLHQY